MNNLLVNRKMVFSLFIKFREFRLTSKLSKLSKPSKPNRLDLQIKSFKLEITLITADSK